MKNIIKYLIYYPLTSFSFWQSVFNVLKYKIMYENKKYLVFFDQDSDRNSFSKLIIQEICKREKVILFVGEKIHPAFSIKNNNLIVIFLDEKFTILFLLLKIPLMITFDTGFTKKAKPKNMHLIHLPHSIVSLTHIYSKGSFDAYDSIFAVGDHHIKELEYLKEMRAWKNKTFLKIRYPKIEGLIKLNHQKKLDRENITILFAPSWGEHNILKLNGIDIINSVLELGYNIIARPHPNSFRFDIDTIKEIKLIERSNSNCKLEDPNLSSMNSYLKSDLMISDWSGAAYEYAFGLLKPVLFIDAPMKVKNNSEIEKKNLPMEFVCREKVGVVASMEDFTTNLDGLISKNDWKYKINLARKKYLYNPNNSITIAINEILKIKKEIE